MLPFWKQIVGRVAQLCFAAQWVSTTIHLHFGKKIINYSSSSLLSVLKSDFHNFHSNSTKISHDFLPIWISITLERCLRTLIYIILRMYCQVDWPLIPLSTLKDSYLSDALIGSRSNESSHVDINRSNAIVNMLVVSKL